MRLSSLARILCYGSLTVLALLSVGVLTATVSAQSVSSPLVQHLPTRPAARPQPTSAPPPQPPKSVPPPDPTPAAISVPPAQITTTQRPLPDSPLAQSVDLTFEELGRSDFGLSELGSRWVSLHLPRNLVPNNEASYLDLAISHVPREPDKLAVVRVTLGGVPLAVIPLSQENAEITTYRYYFKNVPLTVGRNSLQISLDTGAACGVKGARVDVVVYGSSHFHLEYSLNQHSPDLALYPVPFFESSFEYEPVYVVLPDDPSMTDLSAAATIAAGLGKFSYGAIQLASVPDTQISADIRRNHHLIVVGTRAANRLLDELNLPLRLDDPVLSDEQGVIQELVSPWNPLRMILVVTGGSDEGLTKASQALNREVHLFSMQGPTAIVQAVPPPEPLETGPRDVEFTVADLGYEEMTVYGTRPNTIDYRFYVPMSWSATEGSRFTLYFGHSKAASPTTSSMGVYLNDVPVESVLLDESNASEGTLEIPLLSWLIHPGYNVLRIYIEMNLEDEDKCLFLNSQHLWTVLYSYSYFHLPLISQDVEPSLDLFPYPFSKRPNLSGLLLVLPDHPQELDYDLVLKLAAGLGAADQGDFLALDVITADLVTEEVRRDKDLILIGRPSVNSLVEALNDSLPQPFEFGDLLSPQFEPVVFVQDPSRDVGLIEELAAPWDPERMILVLTGATDEGVALASRTLLSEGHALAGNVVLVEEVEESIDIQTFDTRHLLPKPGREVNRPGANQALLIQLGERWW